MFGNENGSVEFDEFLNFLGPRIQLKGHLGHTGGLDKKSKFVPAPLCREPELCCHTQLILVLDDTTGTHSVYTKWRDMEVMFHVSTLLPFSNSPDDKQQIQRKRHLGNDILTLIFMDGKGQWSPTTIKSQFLHIFIVVQRIPSQTPGVRRYRVNVITNEDVPEFGPDVPKPAEFDETDEFRHFLFAKSESPLSPRFEPLPLKISSFHLHSGQWRKRGVQGAKVQRASRSRPAGTYRVPGRDLLQCGHAKRCVRWDHSGHCRRELLSDDCWRKTLGLLQTYLVSQTADISGIYPLIPYI